MHTRSMSTVVVWIVAAAYMAFFAIIASFKRCADATVISLLLIFIPYTSGVSILMG
jgi:hypothetical protein